MTYTCFTLLFFDCVKAHASGAHYVAAHQEYAAPKLLASSSKHHFIFFFRHADHPVRSWSESALVHVQPGTYAFSRRVVPFCLRIGKLIDSSLSKGTANECIRHPIASLSSVRALGGPSVHRLLEVTKRSRLTCFSQIHILTDGAEVDQIHPVQD